MRPANPRKARTLNIRRNWRDAGSWGRRRRTYRKYVSGIRLGDTFQNGFLAKTILALWIMSRRRPSDNLKLNWRCQKRLNSLATWWTLKLSEITFLSINCRPHSWRLAPDYPKGACRLRILGAKIGFERNPFWKVERQKSRITPKRLKKWTFYQHFLDFRSKNGEMQINHEKCKKNLSAVTMVVGTFVEIVPSNSTHNTYTPCKAEPMLHYYL